MRRAAVIVGALLLASASAHGAPHTIPKPPPPSSKDGTIDCKVCARHEAQSYRRDQDCLLANLMLSCRREDGPDAKWPIQAAEESTRIARLASTLSAAPEEPYLSAVELALLPVRLKKASDDLGRKLCGEASTALEGACVAFYCGHTAVEPAPPRLHEARKGLEDLCGMKPECTAKERGLDPATCHEPWIRSQAEVNRALASSDAVSAAPEIYGAATQQAVQHWEAHALAAALKTQLAIRSGTTSALEVTTIVENDAIPALLAMRMDEVKHVDGIAKQLLGHYQGIKCFGDNKPACELDKKGRLAVARTVEETAEHKQLELDGVESSPLSPEVKLGVVEKPLNLMALDNLKDLTIDGLM